MNGKHRQNHRPLRNLHIQTGGILRHIPMSQHDALAFPGGAGGEHDRAQLIRLRHEIKTSFVFLQQFPEAVNLFTVLLLLHGNQRLHFRTVFPGHGSHIFSHIIADQYRGVGTVDQITHIRRRQIHIQRYDDAAAVYRAEISHQPWIRCRPDDCDMIPLLAQIPQKTGKAFTVLAKPGIAFGFDFIFTDFIANRILRSILLLRIDQNFTDCTAKHTQ